MKHLLYVMTGLTFLASAWGFNATAFADDNELEFKKRLTEALIEQADEAKEIAEEADAEIDEDDIEEVKDNIEDIRDELSRDENEEIADHVVDNWGFGNRSHLKKCKLCEEVFGRVTNGTSLERPFKRWLQQLDRPHILPSRFRVRGRVYGVCDYSVLCHPNGMVAGWIYYTPNGYVAVDPNTGAQYPAQPVR